jgi:C4-dicarboxylate transporter, DctM subunit
MEATLGGVLAIVTLFVLMMLGMPIIFTLGVSALTFGLIIYGPSVLPKIGWSTYSSLFNINWIPIPMFVLLGSLIAETTMGTDLFRALRMWMNRIPGGLIVASTWGEAVMAATLGTSATCIIVVGKVAVPEFEKNGYNRSLGLGALLCGGVLGPLIPPSTTMIIYSMLTNVSVGRLFSAGIIPGVLLAVVLSIPTILICIIKPTYGPPVGKFTWGERFGSLTRVWPVALVILSILGSIYTGVATPNEASALGCFAVLIIAVLVFKLRWKGVKGAFLETASITGMMLFIMIGATIFTYVVGSANVGKYIAEMVNSSSISPWTVIVLINIILLILGCLIDPLTITFVTIPIFVPLITNLGFDPLWFGIVFVVNTQIGCITPPMGLDLFTVKQVFNVPTNELLRGVTPYLITLVIYLAIITAFPQLSLWLPSQMIK